MSNISLHYDVAKLHLWRSSFKAETNSFFFDMLLCHLWLSLSSTTISFLWSTIFLLFLSRLILIAFFIVESLLNSCTSQSRCSNFEPRFVNEVKNAVKPILPKTWHHDGQTYKKIGSFFSTRINCVRQDTRISDFALSNRLKIVFFTIDVS